LEVFFWVGKDYKGYLTGVDPPRHARFPDSHPQLRRIVEGSTASAGIGCEPSTAKHNAVQNQRFE